MEQIVSLLVENPLYLVIAVILSIVVLLLFLRKILKLLVIIAAVGILYIAYLYWSGENIPEVVTGIEQFLDEAFRKGAEFIKQFANPG
jgi:threonine/homoserine/homoserine lactone efflux protein